MHDMTLTVRPYNAGEAGPSNHARMSSDSDDELLAVILGGPRAGAGLARCCRRALERVGGLNRLGRMAPRELHRELSVQHEVAVFAVNGHEVPGADDAMDDLQLFTRGVATDVHVVNAVVDDIRAGLEEAVDVL